MKITMDEQTTRHLENKFGVATRLILALNDGSNVYSSAQGCCMIGDRFLLQPVKNSIPPFTIPLENDTFTFYISDYEKNFLRSDLTLQFKPSYGTLQLKSSEGILDLDVELKTASVAVKH